MPLEPGTRLGVYQIVGAIGAGGMGEVYRAHDTSLGRHVAIKALPDAFAADGERLARFEREARVLASLNHPNIAAIYGLERGASATCLVMELAEGETLAARIARGRVPIDDALPIALQIAAALEAAHDKGIVHRDLKPANIVVAPGGGVKVLDFGLAKLAGEAEGSASLSQGFPGPPDSRTMAHAATMAGTLLGTAAYMSPEQARGKAVDKRADIWAFGCVLFEMVSGKAAFAGDTLTDLVAAVVQMDPAWADLPAGVPASMRRVLQRCLTKDPSARLHDIADARIELQEASGRVEGMTAAATPARRAPWPRIGPPLASALVAAALTTMVLRLVPGRAASPNAPVTRFEINLPDGVELYGGNAPGVAPSPDGAQLAFIGVLSGDRRLYVRKLNELEAVVLKGTDQVQTFFFSPGGKSIAFMTPDRILKTISLADGLVVTLARDVDQYSGGAWGTDDRITFSRNGALLQVPASGGPITPLVDIEPAKGERFHTWPAAVAPGNGFLFATIVGDETQTTQIQSWSTATGLKRMLAVGTYPIYVPSGHLAFFRDGALLAAAFDARSMTLTGPAVRIIDRVGMDFAGAPLAGVSETGLLAYAAGGSVASRLVWVSREGLESAATPSGVSSRIQSPRLAPDGRRIAVQMSGRIWVHDTARATFTRLTAGESVVGSGFVTWAPDGKRIVFRTRTGIRWIDVDGDNRSHPLPSSTGIQDIPNSMSPDGETLALTRQDGQTSGDIYVVSLKGDAAPRPVVRTPAYEGGAQFSPDGRWIAYTSNESGRMEVYVRPYPDGERRWTVSTDGGSFVIWKRDGKELFYRNGNRMMAVAVSGRGADLTLSAPRMLFDRRYTFESSTIANYDISLDGQRFLMIKDELGAGRVNVVLNWFEELKRLVPTK